MSDRKKEKLNNDDLSQVKSLIGDARGEDFSLDDILAEYGTKREPEPEAVPRRIVPQPKPQEPEKGKKTGRKKTKKAKKSK